MKKLILMTVLLLMSVEAWGATYYVNWSAADDTGDGSAAHPKKHISAGTALLAHGDTLSIAAGTYSESGSTTIHVTKNNVHVIGAGKGLTILDCSAGGGSPHFYSHDNSGVTISGITFSGTTGSQYQLFLDSDNSTVQDCEFTGYSTGLYLRGTPAKTYYVKRNLFSGSDAGHTSGGIIPGYNTIAYITNNIWRGGTTNLLNSFAINANSGVNSSPHLYVYNNVFADFYSSVMYFYSNVTAAVITSANNVYKNYGEGTTGYILLAGTAVGTATFNNDIMANLAYGASGDFISPGTGFTYTVTNPKSISLGEVHPGRFGYLVYNFDGAVGGVSSAMYVASIFNPLGMFTSVAIPWGWLENNISIDYTHQQVVDYINAGNDIGSHSNTHVNPGDMNAGGLIIDGPTANSKINISSVRTDPDSHNWVTTILIKEGAAVQESMVISGDISQNYARFGTLLVHLNGHNYGSGAWSITKGANGSDYEPTVTLADTSGDIDVSSATVLPLDQTSFFHIEMAESKTRLENWIRTGATGRASTYTINWFVSPGNIYSNAIADAVAAAGYKGMRTGDAYDRTHKNSLGTFYPFALHGLFDNRFQINGGGQISTPTNQITFTASTKAILIPGTVYTWLAAGDVLTVNHSASNNGTYTVANVTTGGGNTTVTVNETLVDEAADADCNTVDMVGCTRVLCEQKYKRQIISFANHIEQQGEFLELWGHAGVDNTTSYGGLSNVEYQWIAETLSHMSKANMKTGINTILDSIWNLSASDNGNSWTVGAGSLLTPDHTLRFDLSFVDQSDYHLLPTSPAINAGANLCATLVNSSDYAGHPVCSGGLFVGKGSAPDIGAYEFQPVLGGAAFFNFDADFSY